MSKLFNSLVFLFLLFSFSFVVSAQNLEIIPESNRTTVVSDVERVSISGWHVWDVYNKTLSGEYGGKRSLADQLSSGIMDWGTILDYFVHFIRYLSQLGIFVGACFIVYAWYIYATAVFGDGKVEKGKTAIKNAIFWVVIITFSYAIMKAVMAAFL